jgi:hypothetical protein
MNNVPRSPSLFFASPLGYVLLLALALGACKKPPVATTTPQPVETKKTASADTVRAEKFGLKQAEFNYWSSRGKLYFKDGKTEQNASVDIRIKKDSVIWLSVRVMSVEALRLLVTQDSLFMIDKVNRDFLALSFDSISRALKLPADFQLVQSTIVGNFPFAVRDPTRAQPEGTDNFLVRQEEKGLDVQGLVSRFNQKLARLLMQDPNSGNKTEVSYGEFTPTGAQTLPYWSSTVINFTNRQNVAATLQFQLTHSRVELGDEPLEFPFKRSGK